MSIGAFTDKKNRPTDEDITRVIGQGLTIWEDLVSHIQKNYPVEEDFKFMYGKNYGWARRYRIRGQFLTSLYPIEGGVTVQVNLSPEAVERALEMDFGKNVQETIAQAHPYPEGRWCFIPVHHGDRIEDIYQLLRLRVEDKHLLRKVK